MISLVGDQDDDQPFFFFFLLCPNDLYKFKKKYQIHGIFFHSVIFKYDVMTKINWLQKSFLNITCNSVAYRAIDWLIDWSINLFLILITNQICFIHNSCAVFNVHNWYI